jgi:hypothetical protein
MQQMQRLVQAATTLKPKGREAILPVGVETVVAGSTMLTVFLFRARGRFRWRTRSDLPNSARADAGQVEVQAERHAVSRKLACSAPLRCLATEGNLIDLEPLYISFAPEAMSKTGNRG